MLLLSLTIARESDIDVSLLISRSCMSSFPKLVMGRGGSDNHLTTCIYFPPHPALLQSIRACPAWGREESSSNAFQLCEIFSGNSCFHLCACAGRVAQLNRRHSLLIVVCIMLAYVLSL